MRHRKLIKIISNLTNLTVDDVLNPWYCRFFISHWSPLQITEIGSAICATVRQLFSPKVADFRPTYLGGRWRYPPNSFAHKLARLLATYPKNFSFLALSQVWIPAAFFYWNIYDTSCYFRRVYKRVSPISWKSWYLPILLGIRGINKF